MNVVGYDTGVNKLRLFDIESVDESLVKKGIDFDKTEIEKNLTLFLYPDDSDEAGNLLRIYQEYFMVSNGAQLIIKELKAKNRDLYRMNEYVVARASQGLANYVNKEFKDGKSIAIGYDSRIKSDVFSKVAAAVFAANGIKVYLWPQLMPVPCVSFAVRYFKCSAGVMVTASHNPSKYKIGRAHV